LRIYEKKLNDVKQKLIAKIQNS
ncbi:hypothetical protein LCGC14_1791290, partial [marine sediment metagenome]